MHTIACSFTLRKNAKRAAETMIRKGTASAVDYAVEPSDDGFKIVWKTAKAAPTDDQLVVLLGWLTYEIGVIGKQCSKTVP
jgi:hypothetical protein